MRYAPPAHESISQSRPGVWWPSVLTWLPAGKKGHSHRDFCKNSSSNSPAGSNSTDVFRFRTIWRYYTSMERVNWWPAAFFWCHIANWPGKCNFDHGHVQRAGRGQNRRQVATQPTPRLNDVTNRLCVQSPVATSWPAPNVNLPEQYLTHSYGNRPV
jgi:hypothetical protein